MSTRLERGHHRDKHAEESTRMSKKNRRSTVDPKVDNRLLRTLVQSAGTLSAEFLVLDDVIGWPHVALVEEQELGRNCWYDLRRRAADMKGPYCDATRASALLVSEPSSRSPSTLP